jgi:Flp pilus assembly protein TadG
MSASFTVIRHFGCDRRGNLSVIFALACLPLISAVGCAVDYARATQIKAKLQAAADAASLGAIATNSLALRIAAVMNSDGPIGAGAVEARQIFNANISGVTGLTLESLTPDVQKTGKTITSTLTFRATVPTYFLGIMGMHTLTVAGGSSAVVGAPVVFWRKPGGPLVYRTAPHLVGSGPAVPAGGTLIAPASQFSATVTTRRNP